FVDVGGEPVGQRGVLDLEHIFGVPLARAREVEAACEDDVVGDGDLRVHEVVNRAGAIGSRTLAGELAGQHSLQQGQLPGEVAAPVPFVDHALDLRAIQAAGEVDPVFR